MADLRCGVIGCGNIGSAVVSNLLKRGFKVSVFDLNQERLRHLNSLGARVEASANALALCSDVIITALQNPPQVRSVMEDPNGVFSVLRPGQIWIEHTTTDYQEVTRLSTLATNRGVATLEAPLTGGLTLLEQGEMTVFVGGDPAAFDKVLPILRCYTSQQLNLGPVGSATVVKVISNQLCAVNTVSMGESIAIAAKFGVNLSKFFDAIRASAGNTYVFETEAPLVFNGSFDPGFTMDLHCKDLRLGKSLSDQLGVPCKVMDAAKEVYERSREHHGGHVGSSYPAKLVQEESGVSLQTPGFENWGYKVQVVEGSLAVLHQNRTDKPRSRL